MEVVAETKTVTDTKTPAPTGQEPKSAGSEPSGQEPGGQQAAQDVTTQEPGALDYSDPTATEAVIKQLREENAKLRTRGKERDSEFDALNDRFSKFETGLKSLFSDGDEVDDLTPEQQVEVLQARNEQLEVNAALRDAASEYNIPNENFEFFEFLVGKRLNEMEEGEELSEEDLDAIAQRARGMGGASPNTSIDGEGTSPEPGAQSQEVSLEEFVTMSVMAKSQLYQKNPQLYDQLKKQEAAARKLR